MTDGSSTPRVALVTAREARSLDEDLPPLIAAFGAAGASVTVVDWDDPVIDWASFDLALVRSAWDYHVRLPEFLAWGDRASRATRLHNPVEVLRWNTDKRYLDDLGRAGVPAVPTTWCHPAAPAAPLPASGEVVVKPAVSAGSRDTARFVIDDPTERAAATAHVAGIVASGKVAMIQPYLDSVDQRGETAVIVIDGVVSHGVRKGPLLAPGGAVTDGLFAAEELTVRQPDDAELEVVRAAVDHVRARFGHLPLYARVDLVADAAGAPVLLELELTEPSLFFDLAPGSADVYARAALERLAAG